MSSSRHLLKHVGKRVAVDMDNPEGRFEGVLMEIRASGPRVKFDSPYLRERTVAWWRIRPLEGRDR